ncbi:hypothetical protein LIX60_00560 [Streptomyces sp. S07_1.15]|uniref:hypothetical protein n=1 Tax=Streptomyces sp. S07_1.15 TaxID=2873925 RepID=UPI001D153DEC|nr:hypothetical protein [Streptomyces sp. S07_1.15]MCC3650012.1 hypothetical protein [Streptomyces sp. S07_1.15]
MGVDELAEELYALPPGEFIAARDRAAAAAPRGERGAIRALRRPSLAAWAVNLLVREDRSRTELLLRLGAELRTAHQQPAGGGRLRELIGQQRQLVAALARRAGQLTADAGRPVSDAVLREVEDTVHAALADPDAARDMARGRLTRAFPPPSGFGVLPEATVLQLRPPSAAPAAREPGSGRRTAGGGAGGDRAGTGADDADGPDGPDERERRASVTDITERARAQERADRERRQRLRKARGEAEELARAARGSAEEATVAERELAAARRRLREAREQVHGLTEELRRAKRSLSAAERAERAARGPAQRARQAAERDRKRAEAARAEADRAEADRLAPDPARPPGRRGRRRPGAPS